MTHATALPPMLTTGLDLGDRTTHRCTLDGGRQVVARGRFTTTREALVSEFGGIPRQRIVIEAGSQSLWVSHLLRELGHEVMVCSTKVLDGVGPLIEARIGGVSRFRRGLHRARMRGDMPDPVFVPHRDRHDPGVPPAVAARAFFEVMRKRRTVRQFSERPVDVETIEWIVRAAHSAPSGANKQPWRFVCVRDPAVKRRIRAAAEREEREFYAHRANAEWLEDLRPLGTDDHKEFLERAPWLIVAFQLVHLDDGGQVYYLKESVGIACGFLLAAAHHAGLATLTHTPSPMGFLNEVLGRPPHERPFLLIPVGWAADDCVVPERALERRPLEQVMVVV